MTAITHFGTVLVLSAGILLSTSCRVWAGDMDDSAAIALSLPADLEPNRSHYLNSIEEALGHVTSWFAAAGFTVHDSDLVNNVVVYSTRSSAQRALAEAFDIDTSAIPPTFCGTVGDRTLHLVSEDLYRQTWTELYPGWPRSDRAYVELMIHELAHAAHESVAIREMGLADAMGPAWFFEGLAIACAGQFASDSTLWNRDEILERVGNGCEFVATYPVYGRLIRSLLREISCATLIRAAGRSGFPDSLW